MKPKHAKRVLIILLGGEIHEGHFLKHINKYVRDVNQWKIYKTGKTVPDEEVLAWIDLEEFEELVADGRLSKVRINYNLDI